MLWVYQNGSSPLARGLRCLRLGRRRRAGIIPARAGFTAPRILPRRSRQDHPRSRGVYTPPESLMVMRKGSSPLARGLRHASRCEGGRDRIIPARAGFTGRRRHACCAARDHPRSRGVYGVCVDLGIEVSGSSPLARGLREDGGRLAGRPRIIPARAGFTQKSPAQNHTHADHPRSRGVYRDISWKNPLAAGSSPLARGLREIVAGSAAAKGIIPARAGFTNAQFYLYFTKPDHPRSRGVYLRCRWIRIRRLGSSPLARGLLTIFGAWSGVAGIIPARAGFTLSSCRSARRTGDHPHSRGVYPSGQVRYFLP